MREAPLGVPFEMPAHMRLAMSDDHSGSPVTSVLVVTKYFDREQIKNLMQQQKQSQ